MRKGRTAGAVVLWVGVWPVAPQRKLFCSSYACGLLVGLESARAGLESNKRGITAIEVNEG